MKTQPIFRSLVALALVLGIIWSCKKEDAVPAPTPTPTPTPVTKSTAKDITKFSFAALSPAVDATIDATAKTISATVPAATDLTKLVPTITISDKATISPASGVATDFSKEVSYTVTAEDASTVVWKVKVISSFPTNDLVAYFPFNGSAKDESGKGIDGKLNGAVLAKDRKGNQNCYSFDGKSNITFDKIPSIGIDNWAISFWTNNTIDKQLAMFISLGNEDGSNSSGYSIGYGDGLDNTGYKMQGVFGGVALVPWNISGQNDAGAWRHFVMQRQNGVTKFYFAGKLLFTSNVLSNPKQPTSFTIGSGSSGSKLPRNYNGSLDDIRIYNRVLSDQEIMALSLE